MKDPQGSLILLHGPPKVGKTSLAASFPGPVMILSAGGGYHYLPERHKRIACDLDNWEDFDKHAGGHTKWPKGIKTIVLDEVGRLYAKCKRYVCSKYKVKHPSDKGEFGRTIWNVIGDEFGLVLDEFVSRVRKIGATLIIISHTSLEEVETATSTEIKMMSDLPTQARRWITGAVDHIWCLCYGEIDDEDTDVEAATKNFGDTRQLVIRGGELVEAGTQDRSIRVKRICPLMEPNLEEGTGGFRQIVRELSSTKKSKRKKRRK